ncbi:uncharacterized protein LOC5520712 [Nematostella vectensis]|nr:uncharacterized protein LOC5520712 [Nematostella vectensis]
MAKDGDGYGFFPGSCISIEGILKILELVFGVVAFALVLSHEDAKLFSHYGFFIVVSGLCWIGALLFLIFHLFGCCNVCCLGKWQKEYSLWIFLLSYALSFFFFFLFASALLVQWTKAKAVFVIAAILGFILVVVFFIECILYYRRVRKIRTTEVAWEGAKTRNI